MGNNPRSYATHVLPTAVFTRLQDFNCLDIPTIVGAAGHQAAPPVFRTGPHAAGTANTNTIRVQSIHVLPASFTGMAVSAQRTGRFTFAAFFGTFLQGRYDSATAVEAALWAPTAAWFRVASTNRANGLSVVTTDRSDPGLAHADALREFVNLKVADMMALISVGGPGLTVNAFDRGINTLGDRMRENTQAHIEFERNSRLKTFADKHGTALEARIVRFTGRPDATTLPEVHDLLVNCHKGREYSVLNAQFQERAEASTLPINSENCPIATPSLLDQVFRNYQPQGNGLTLGQGLSPFAIVCEGHAEVENLKVLIKKAELVEGSATVSLSDAASLTTNDVCLPTVAYIAIEKLLGWSVVVDVFHGATQPIAVAIQNAVKNIGPKINRLVNQASDTHSV
ncbi:MAG: hypothetical protein LC687_03275, partial [Actinobacteria bacterium]|nr:hypothetical protein [Actinomycetota bacterium]